jgi:hypothetical protein
LSPKIHNSVLFAHLKDNMMSENIVWAENIPENLKAWVVGFFSAADSKEDEFARKFSDLFAENATMEGMSGPIHGQKGEYYTGSIGPSGNVERYYGPTDRYY